MNSYKKSLMRNILTICLAFSVIFVIIMYIAGYRFAKKSLIENASAYTSLTASRFDGAMTKTQDFLTMFRSNQYVKNFVDADPPSPFTHLELIKNVMSQANSTPSMKKTVAIARPGDSYVISGSSMSLDRFLGKYGIPRTTLESIIELFSDPLSIEPLIYISESEGIKYFTVAICDIKSYSKPFIVFCVFELDQLMGNLPENSSLLISVDNKPFYCTSEFTQDKLMDISSGKASGLYNTIAEISDVSTVMGVIKYTLIMPKFRYFTLVNQYSVFVLIGFILLFLMSLLFSEKTTQKNYGPIQKILNQLESLDINDNKEDIEYISSAINLLTQRNKALSSLVDTNREKLKDKFLGDLMHNLLSDEQIRYGLHSYFPDTEKIFPVALIIADAYADFPTDELNSTDDAHSFDTIVRQIFAREFSKERFFNFSVISPLVYCVIVSVDDHAALTERTKKMLLTAEADLGVAIHSSISAGVTSWYDLPNAFFLTHIAHTSRTHSLLDSPTVMTGDVSEVSIFYNPEIEERITDCCMHGDEESLKNILDLLVSENFKAAETFAEKRSQLSLLIYALCMRIFATLNISSEAIFGKEYNIYLELNLPENSSDYHERLTLIFGNIVRYISSLKTIHESRYGDRMLSFIHDNYDKDIALIDLAEYMNMSQVYVSKLFKKLNRCNFKDYLTQIRIGKATQLLTDRPSMSISEISKSIGFNNEASFLKSFKNSLGITPSEYRKTHLYTKPE